MEVGHAGQHFNKRWDAGSRGKDGYFSAEIWKDSSNGSSSSSSNGGSWKHAATSTTLPPSSISSPSPSQSNSLSSLMPIVAADGSVDKVLYQNLVEMIPLVETFMDKKNNKSVTRHASLVYTPTPSHKTRGPGHSSKGSKGRGQFPRYKTVGMKHNVFWENAENFNSDDREDMHFSTDLDAVDKAIITQLQDQVEQLEQKLQEKESLLQAAEEDISRQADILSLQAKMEELHDQILLKEQELREGMDMLSSKQQEVASLRSLLEEAESEVQASNFNVGKVQGELHNLQCHVATFLVRMQNVLLNLENEQAASQVPMPTHLPQAKENGDQVEDDQTMELTRRKYLASLIAAREKPSEELLLLVAELRGQLQHYLTENN